MVSFRYRCKTVKVGNTYELLLDQTSQREPFVYDVVEKHSDWKAALVDIRPAGSSIEGFGVVKGPPKVIMVGGAAEPLAAFSIKRGLKNLTLQQMKTLYKAEGLQTRRTRMPNTENVMLKAFCNHFLGEAQAEEVFPAAVAERSEKCQFAEELIEQTCLQVGNISDMMEEDFSDEELEDEIEACKAVWNKRRIVLKQKEAAMSGNAGPSAPSLPRAGGQRRKTKAPLGPGMSRQVAASYVPPQAKLSKQTEWHTRWRISAPYLSEKGKAYDANTVGAEVKALLFCLRLAWSRWTHLSGQECPWGLE